MAIRRVSLVVRTLASHAGITGSSPVLGATLAHRARKQEIKSIRFLTKRNLRYL